MVVLCTSPFASKNKAVGFLSYFIKSNSTYPKKGHKKENLLVSVSTTGRCPLIPSSAAKGIWKSREPDTQ